jgi:tetratricopeptide (TPR) repeat protein
MSRAFSCSQGHTWQTTDDASAGGAAHCPVCGSVAWTSGHGPASLPTAAVPSLVPEAATLRLPDPAAVPASVELGVPCVPGYEILEVLGRGGMGVVYKARQQALQRVVALKMILHGAQARPADLARFRTEAQTVARLQHPNIVQIHEVGECNGRPYLALEYVAGGPLSKQVAGAPQPARAAAALVETLARAIHVAHRHGIVHRDLKPANILLVSGRVVSGEWSDQDTAATTHHSPLTTHQPKITDFGLAKTLDVAGHTHTGDILGTPCYMAPEQAGGRKDIGPGVDLYALGAILYELLTGRPPFLAETTLDTLLQVVQAEPVPPSRLNVKTPRDLETICLCCLHKDPRRRYATALDLAEDLRRFQHHEPILARPVGRGERLVKWARRRPATAALLAVGLAALLVLLAGAWWHNRQLTEQRDEADAQRRTAQEQHARAEKHFLLALQAVDQMLVRVGQRSLDGVPQAEQVRRELLEDALQFYGQFRGEDQQPELRWKTARAYRLVGDIQRVLRNYEEAARASAQAVALLEVLLAETPGRAEVREDLAAAHTNLALVYQAQGDLDRALVHARLALAARRRLVQDFPARTSYRHHLAFAHLQIGKLLFAGRQLDEAGATYHTALDEQRQALAGQAGDPEQRFWLSLTHHHLGELASAQGDAVTAEAAFREALKLQEDLAKENWRQPDYAQELAKTLAALALTLQQTKRHDDAEPLFLQALVIRGQLATRFPARADLMEELAGTFKQLAVFYRETKRPLIVEKAYRNAIKAQEGVVALTPSAAKPRLDLALQYHALGLWLAETGGDADPAFAAAARNWKTLSETAPQAGEYLQNWAVTLKDWAAHVHQRGDTARARTLLEEALSHLDTVLQLDPHHEPARALAGRVKKQLQSLTGK